MNVLNELREKGLQLGVVEMRGIRVGPSPDGLWVELTKLVEERATQDFPPPAVKESVRAMLRAGGFKPSGRSKPASEYLAQAAREHRFPFINNVVDINNWLSLKTGWPISLLDRRATGVDVVVRFGREGEKYVFNTGGQEIDLNGLISVCRASPEGGVPLGNPVKDSMEGKVKEDTTEAAYFVFVPGSVSADQLRSELERMVDLANRFGGTDQVTCCSSLY